MKRRKRGQGRSKSARRAAINTAIQLIRCQCNTLECTVRVMTHINPLEFLGLQLGTTINTKMLQVHLNPLAEI